MVYPHCNHGNVIYPVMLCGKCKLPVRYIIRDWAFFVVGWIDITHICP